MVTGDTPMPLLLSVAVDTHYYRRVELVVSAITTNTVTTTMTTTTTTTTSTTTTKQFEQFYATFFCMSENYFGAN